jgi:hypothetical protein
MGQESKKATRIAKRIPQTGQKIPRRQKGERSGGDESCSAERAEDEFGSGWCIMSLYLSDVNYLLLL